MTELEKLKVRDVNHLPGTGADRLPVYSKQFNNLIEALADGTLNLQLEDLTVDDDLSVGDDLTVSGDAAVTGNATVTGAISGASGKFGNTSNAIVKTDLVTLTATEIVGTSAGDIGHAAGAVLVTAQAGKTYEFISAVLIFDFDTAAYTGGNNDLVIRQGTTAVSAAIADADLIGDTADDIAYVNALAAADIKLTANSTLNLAGTAYTNPGTAAGVLRVYITYREITTGL